MSLCDQIEKAKASARKTLKDLVPILRQFFNPEVIGCYRPELDDLGDPPAGGPSCPFEREEFEDLNHLDMVAPGKTLFINLDPSPPTLERVYANHLGQFFETSDGTVIDITEPRYKSTIHKRGDFGLPGVKYKSPLPPRHGIVFEIKAEDLISDKIENLLNCFLAGMRHVNNYLHPKAYMGKRDV